MLFRSPKNAPGFLSAIFWKLYQDLYECNVFSCYHKVTSGIPPIRQSFPLLFICAVLSEGYGFQAIKTKAA